MFRKLYPNGQDLAILLNGPVRDGPKVGHCAHLLCMVSAFLSKKGKAIREGKEEKEAYNNTRQEGIGKGELGLHS